VLLSTEHIRMVGAKELNRSVKFAAKFIGPFKIVQVVNPNAYRLELPGTFGMHPTVNVSRLRKFVDGSEQFPSREVEEWRPSGVVVRDENGQLEFEVERILAQRGRDGRAKQYLVKWKGYPLWESTWEGEKNLENAQKKLGEFRERIAAGAAAGEERITGIFKDVESVTVQKEINPRLERLKEWIAKEGISVGEAMKGLLEEL